MPAPSFTVPTANEPTSTEEPKIITALAEIKSILNGNIDTDNMASGVIPAPFPAGSIMATARATAPTDWLICDGTAILRAGVYADLFTAIGTAYGVGNGSTTFNLPDLQGRIPVGLGTHADVNALNDNDGAALASRTAKHTHSGGSLISDSSHSHTATVPSVLTGGPSSTYLVGGGGAESVPIPSHYHATSSVGITTSAGSSTDGVSGTTGSGTPSFVVVNFIIKT